MDGTITKHSMKPPHPGAFIREEVLEELGLSVATAAKVLNIRRTTLSDFVNEKASLSPEMALRIEKAFGVNMDMLLGMQAGYDTANMRERANTVMVQRYNPSACA